MNVATSGVGQTHIKPGRIAVVHGLIHDAVLNGAYVEIITELRDLEVATARGRDTGPWHGVEVIALHRDIGDGCYQFRRPIWTTTGYLKIANLAFLAPEADRRSICLHLFGEES